MFKVNYLGGEMPTFALNFSRPAGEIVAQYYNLLRLGREGYRAIHQTCADTAAYLAGELARMGCFEPLYEGRGALPAICYTAAEDAGFSLYDLSTHLRIKGWQVPSYPLPADREETVVQRVLIRHGVSRDTAALLADDIR
ncbi:pyridoxal-dependent decarboxylase [Acrocarpospora catenulata]|uniref:pyridoxal-dependent decarboxylase n=1 Tax=Acrocarpospora catenulata TaxID=2836182 RepID=UPI0027E01149|nr:pyridoxal-dependent decarboxylase [Acrocarpospora catenulata]